MYKASSQKFGQSDTQARRIRIGSTAVIGEILCTPASPSTADIGVAPSDRRLVPIVLQKSVAVPHQDELAGSGIQASRFLCSEARSP